MIIYPYIFDETQCIFSKYYHNNILHYESLKDLTDLNGYDSTKEISIINNNFKINAIIGKISLDNFNITKKSSILFKEWIKKRKLPGHYYLFKFIIIKNRC